MYSGTAVTVAAIVNVEKFVPFPVPANLGKCGKPRDMAHTAFAGPSWQG